MHAGEVVFSHIQELCLDQLLGCPELFLCPRDTMKVFQWNESPKAQPEASVLCESKEKSDLGSFLLLTSIRSLKHS